MTYASFGHGDPTRLSGELEADQHRPLAPTGVQGPDRRTDAAPPIKEPS